MITTVLVLFLCVVYAGGVLAWRAAGFILRATLELVLAPAFRRCLISVRRTGAAERILKWTSTPS